MTKNIFIGIDIGSVSANFVAIDEDEELIEKVYIRTRSRPIEAMCEGLLKLQNSLGGDYQVAKVGATGSGRNLSSIVCGVDVVKNEITAHLVGAKNFVPDVKTIIEIGGQDSKLIVIDENAGFNFAMNTVCAAGTGAFLDRIAERVGMTIEELGQKSIKNAYPVNIAGRCAVFAETDMIHKIQGGHGIIDVYSGLCRALVRNYINNLAKDMKISKPIVFQGGVAANIGIKEAFELEIGEEIFIPPNFDVMGAYGAALLAKKFSDNKYTRFKGFNRLKGNYKMKSRECKGCSNMCEISSIEFDGEMPLISGGKCSKMKILNM